MAGAPPDGTGQVTDISGCTGIRFYVKGDGKSYHVKIPYSDVNDVSLTGYNDYRYDFTTTANWAQVDIPFALFAQATGWGTAFPRATVLANAKAFQFQTSFYAPTGTTTAELWIDNVEIYGCTAACPAPAGQTPTATIPAAATNTNTVPPAATATFTSTNTAPPGSTATFTGTNTAIPTSTNTAFVPTNTNTNTPITPAATSTFTHTFTATNTQTPSFTFTNTFTNTPSGPTATPTPTDIPGNITVSGITIVGAVSNTLDITGAADTVRIGFFIGVESADKITLVISDNNGTPKFVRSFDGSYPVGYNEITLTEADYVYLANGASGVLGNYTITVENTSSGNSDTAGLANQYVIVNAAVPTFTPGYATPVPTATPSDELKIKDDKLLPYPNPANGGDVSIKFALTRNAKSVTFKLYTSASRLVRELEIPASKINMGLNGLKTGDNIITVPAESFKDIANGTFYYILILEDDKGNTVKSKVDKIVIIKGKTAK